MEMTVLFMLILLSIFALMQEVHTARYNYDYMFTSPNNCSSIQVLDLLNKPASYGFVRVVEKGGYPSPINCTIDIVALDNHYFNIRFTRIQIYQPNRQCTTDYLLLTGNTTSREYCGSTTPYYSLRSTSNRIRLNFVANNSLASNSRIGFELYYTTYRNGPCGSSDIEFRCVRYGICIPRELTCDGLDNCGDNSDERAKVCGLSIGWIIVIVLLSIAVSMSLISAVFYVCYKNKRARSVSSTTTTQTSDPAVVFTPTQGAQFMPPPSYSDIIANDQPKDEPPPPYTETTNTNETAQQS